MDLLTTNDRLSSNHPSQYHSRRSGGNSALGQSEVSEEKMEATFLQYMDWVFWQQIYMRKYMGVSENRGTLQIIHLNRVFHYKPSILGYPYFLKHPYGTYGKPPM